MDPQETPPDIFRAAENNDLEELIAALEDGQLLSDQDPARLMMTPVHVAAARSSNEFLKVSAHHDSFDPWILDDNERRPIDHAMANANTEGQEFLRQGMYAHLHDVDPQIDYTDNEPSEVYPG